MKKGFLAFGFFIIFGLLNGCKQQTVEEIDTTQFKQFIEDEEIGFVALTYNISKQKENMAHVTRAMEDNKLSVKHFSYSKQNREKDRHFLYNNGIEQGTETLAYYKNGVLWEEFNFPRIWIQKRLRNYISLLRK